jgi:hypothetical protein
LTTERKLQRPAAFMSSRARPRPTFAPASDLDPNVAAELAADEGKRPATIGELYDAMIEGFDYTDGRIDALAVRVAKVELVAWKRRLLILGRALAPAALGYLAHYVPNLTAHIPGILKALESWGQ